MPSNKLWTLLPTVAGFMKSRYPDGNDAAEPPIWAVIPDQVQKSAAYSLDMTAYLSGPYTSMSLIVVTGVLSGSGWSFAGTTLTYSGTGTGVLTVRIQANNGATVAKSNVFTIESILVQAADTIPATVPVYVSASLNSSDKPVVTWRASSDPALDTVLWSGLASYKLYRNGSLITTQAGAAGPKFIPRLQTIGVPPGSGSFSRSSTDAKITLSARGLNYFNTADDGFLAGDTITGDFFASCKVESCSSSNSAAKLMIDCRSSIAADSPHVAGSLFPFSSGRGYNLYYRTSTAGSTTKNSETAYSGSIIWLALARVGDVFTFSTSPDGVNFTVHSSVTVALPTTCILGIAGCGQTAGASMDAVVAQWNVSQAGMQSYTDSAAAADTLCSYSLTATDVAGNASSQSAAVSIQTPAVASAALYKLIDFETGARPTNASLSVSPGAAIDQSVLMTVQSSIVHRGVYASKIDLNGAGTPAPYRGEYTISSGIRDTERQYLRHRGYGISIYWPSAYYSIPDPIWEVNLQWHYYQQASGDTWSGEPLLFMLINNVLTMKAQYNYSVPGHPTLQSNTDRGSLDVVLGTLGTTLAFDQWHRFVFHVVWDPRPTSAGGVGYFECWRNGIKLVGPGTSINPAGYIRIGITEDKDFNGSAVSPPSSPYPKFGIYKGWTGAGSGSTPTPGVTRRVIYHDDWRDSSGTSFNYNDVA